MATKTRYDTYKGYIPRGNRIKTNILTNNIILRPRVRLRSGAVIVFPLGSPAVTVYGGDASRSGHLRSI